ncbi:hypothetical protein ABGB18_28560 [Nonomuraea sp. B12E4]|uniref:hypothetical protein n=1 Tax=Nonomuraea sp. B12E4 TaxID=3153564 RepID=UPI00325DF93E
MRFNPVVVLAGPALITAFFVGPVAGTPASAAQDFTRTSMTDAQDSAPIVAAPPKKKKKAKEKQQAREQQYNRGHNAGFNDGRADCKANRAHDLQYTGGGDFKRGFTEGYNAGFHSCTRPAGTMPKPGAQGAPQ